LYFTFWDRIEKTDDRQLKSDHWRPTRKHINQGDRRPVACCLL
jgi:hypothetical protein